MRNHLLTFLLCVIAAAIFTLPASLSPASALLGYPGDNFQHAWFLWHFARAIASGHDPFYTHLLFYPARANLAWSTLDPLAGILALPLSMLAGPVIAYNLSLILQLALAAFFARLLCLRICRNEIAALFGGIAFGLGPFLLAHALGHLSLVTAFPIPLYVLALDNLLRKEVPSWKEGVLAGLALLLTAFGHYNYTVFCILLTAVILTVDLAIAGAANGRALLKRTWFALTVAAATFVAAFSPVLIMLLGNRADVPSPRTMAHVTQYSADALGFLIPSWNNVLLGNFAHGLDARIFVAGFEGTVYAGPVLLLLAILGIWKGPARHPQWTVRAALAAILFYLLSLGPEIRILGRLTEIPGPAALLYHFRFARFISVPARFDVIVLLCLAVLSAIGLAWCLDNLQKNWHKRALVFAASSLLVLESLTIPFPKSSIVDPAASSDATVPLQSCTLPASAQRGAVLTFPLQQWPYVQKAMWIQLTDGGRFALVDGYLSYVPRDVWHQFYDLPLLRSLMSLQGTYRTPVNPAADRPSIPATIRRLHLSAVVVFDSPQHDAAVHSLNSALGVTGQPAGSCTVFPLTPQNAAVQVPPSHLPAHTANMD
ncbi:MAG TPA: hypothetical protein VGR84_13645 [Candidatus Acidoferrales bacterium]|nr:hypothetical protein [Candidatus Acidoferrales bacterium]